MPLWSTAVNLSARRTLPVATQNVLAVHTAAIPIPPHAGAPVRPVSVAAPRADVDVDIAALLPLRPVTARTFATRAHLSATIALILRYAWIAAFFLRCASTRTLTAVLAASA